MRDRRSRLEIYYTIMIAMLEDRQRNTKLSKTRIQQKAKTSYDKLIRYLGIMEQKGLIKIGKDIEITDTGIQFVNDYTVVDHLIKNIVKGLE